MIKMSLTAQLLYFIFAAVALAAAAPLLQPNSEGSGNENSGVGEPITTVTTTVVTETTPPTYDCSANSDESFLSTSLGSLDQGLYILQKYSRFAREDWVS